jgi:hypothetical protein
MRAGLRHISILVELLVTTHLVPILTLPGCGWEGAGSPCPSVKPASPGSTEADRAVHSATCPVPICGDARGPGKGRGVGRTT